MRYATLEDLQKAIEQENKERPSFNLERRIDPNYVQALSLAQNQDDKNLIIQISEGEAYLSESDKRKLWTITNPSELSSMLASTREKALGGEVCKNRKKDVDKYGRKGVDIDTLDYYTCAGDDPRISIDRENMVSRLAYPNYPVYPLPVPLGLTSQRMGMNPISEIYPANIPLINMGEVIVPYGLSNMTSKFIKYIPQGLNM
jgi:hypothetical protein